MGSQRSMYAIETVELGLNESGAERHEGLSYSSSTLPFQGVLISSYLHSSVVPYFPQRTPSASSWFLPPPNFSSHTSTGGCGANSQSQHQSSWLQLSVLHRLVWSNVHFSHNQLCREGKEDNSLQHTINIIYIHTYTCAYVYIFTDFLQLGQCLK